jgi:type III secretory pathway component EscU
MRHLVEAVKAVIKTLVLGGALYLLLKNALHPLVLLPFHGISSIVQIAARLLQYLFLVTIIVFIMLSLVDLIIQKRVFLHENRMSKDDVKRDHKEAEGDPFIKGRRKSLHAIINTPEFDDTLEKPNDNRESR